jgi:hypothetical protein
MFTARQTQNRKVVPTAKKWQGSQFFHPKLMRGEYKDCDFENGGRGPSNELAS